MRKKTNKETMFVSFSGGRTSGYMCRWLLDNKADEYDFIFVFANHFANNFIALYYNFSIASN